MVWIVYQVHVGAPKKGILRHNGLLCGLKKCGVKKKETFPWLDCKSGKLGCKICRDVSHLGAFKKERIHISKEWLSYCVTYYGSSRTTQLTSLRKKISDHKQSTAHLTAENIMSEAKTQTLEKVCDSMNESHLASTKSVFRTAYYIAKSDRPYSDHFELLELQKLNGVDIGVGLHSRYSSVEIIDHISKEMKQKVIRQILEISGNISVITDESTTLGAKSTLIVYLKCEVSKEIPPHFLFLDLIELPEQKSETVFELLLNCLNRHGFHDDYLKEHLISFASDGASVMLGKNSGVANKLINKYPNIIIWHCMNHRLELALSDAVDEVTGVNHFQIFMDKLYTLYSKSPKNQRELAACALELDQQMNKIGRILSTRWVASSFRTVSAVWYGYQSLFNHFNLSSKDSSKNSTNRAMYTGLITRFASPQFLKDLAIMYDILAELSMLSESLQNRNITVFYADKLIRRSIRFIELLKEKPGTKCLEAEIAIKEGIFCGIELIENRKISAINQQQLLTSVVNNLKRRLLTTISSNENKSTAVETKEKQEDYNSLINELKVLESDQWPSEKLPGFGECEIESLCRRFKLNVTKTKNAYRDYLEDSSRVPKYLNNLMNCTKLIPCSSSECERGFSQMNLIVSPTRTRLTTAHVSSLMFVKLHGPNLRDWNIEPYVQTWLRKHRSADDTRIREAKPKKSDEDNIFARFL